ncbi:MAG: M23 family metallopeptidase [Thermodesulfobacteriota bacterium]|nr:M23 family metallopeptidase [Thermodesulfobacteriota bacterium]
MFGKKITVFFLPQGPHKVKEYTFPKALPLVGLFLGLIVFAGLLTFSIHAHLQNRRIAGQEAELRRLLHKTAKQNVQIYAFADKIRLLNREMANLRQFDKKLRAMTGSEPRLKKASVSGLGGSESEASRPMAVLKGNAEDLIRRMHRDLERLLAEAGVRERSQQEIGKALEDSKSIIDSTPDSRPLNGRITSRFGYRTSPFSSRTEFHRGIDISAPMGSPIVAPADGIVVSTDWNSGYGLILTINHGYGVVTRYAHISQSYVKPGRRVRRGERVAAVGVTGRTTGPHLHYEVIQNGIPVNPMPFLTAHK